MDSKKDPVAYIAYAGGLDAVAASETLVGVVETCVKSGVDPAKTQIHRFYREGGKDRLTADTFTVLTGRSFKFGPVSALVDGAPRGTVWAATIKGWKGTTHHGDFRALLKLIAEQMEITSFARREDIEIVGLHPNGETQAVPSERYLTEVAHRRWKTREELLRDADSVQHE